MNQAPKCNETTQIGIYFGDHVTFNYRLSSNFSFDIVNYFVNIDTIVLKLCCVE